MDSFMRKKFHPFSDNDVFSMRIRHTVSISLDFKLILIFYRYSTFFAVCINNLQQFSTNNREIKIQK